MERTQLKGATLFGILYNIFGFIALHSCVYGFRSSVLANTMVIRESDYVQFGMIIIMVLLFATSYLIIARKKAGIVLPVFLLTFFIFGGFLILVPILIVHLLYFLNPNIKAHFA